MSLRLVCLHGFTQNGRLLAGQLAGITSRLPGEIELVFPDAPHPCAAASVERMAMFFKVAPPPPPHLCWWDASEDGAEYRGWEVTREQLQPVFDKPGRVGVLGFSQGAILATALAALQQHAQFPRIDFAILIAGRTPRARELAPRLQAPLRLPSLHIWGERDAGAVKAAPELARAYAQDSCEVVTWPGPHVVPQRGAAADAIVTWLQRHTKDTEP